MFDTIHQPEPAAPETADNGFRNREEWLNRAAALLLAYCAERGFPTERRPYISVGFPRGARPNTVGQCWTGERSADGNGHIFIHPGVDDAHTVLHILLHELGHDIVGVQHGHKAPFSQWCAAVGLVKPWTATTPDEALTARLHTMMEALGEYPHAALDASKRPTPKRPRRDHTFECDGCGRRITAYGNDPLVAEHIGCGRFFEVERQDA
jgi:hypothetical protein